MSGARPARCGDRQKMDKAWYTCLSHPVMWHEGWRYRWRSGQDFTEPEWVRDGDRGYQGPLPLPSEPKYIIVPRTA